MCIDDITKIFILNCYDISWVDKVSKILESNFIMALVGTFVGAYSAHKLAESQNNKKRLLEELRNTNSAILICADVMETCINLKINHIAPMVVDYKKDISDFNDFLELAKNDPLINLHLSPKFNTINLPSFELNIFRHLIFEAISLDGRSLKSAFTFLRSLDFLENFIKCRNEILASKNNSEGREVREVCKWYFAHEDDSGHTNKHFQTYVYGIEKYLNDCIMYMRILIAQLEKHSQSLNKQCGNNQPIHPKINVSKYINVMPSFSDYPAFT